MVSRTSPSKRVLLALGVALLASLSLFASLALGAKLPPENTALPVVSPTTPTIGKEMSTTKGTWTNEPTSYTYAWFRCSAAGTECTSIAGKTSAWYLVTEADAGHTLVSAVTAINAFGKTTAQSKATNKIVLPTQYWYSCVKGEGKFAYSDSACTTEAKGGSYTWKKLTTSTAFTMNGTAPVTVNWTIGAGSIPVAVSCSQSGEGSINNPAGEGAGTASVNFTLSGCSVIQPEGFASECKVTAGTFGLAAQATELEGKPALRFNEASSFTLVLNGANCALLGTYKFTGAFSGVANSATSSLEFSSAGSSLIQGGHPAWISGTSKVQTKAGEALKLAS